MKKSAKIRRGTVKSVKNSPTQMRKSKELLNINAHLISGPPRLKYIVGAIQGGRGNG